MKRLGRVGRDRTETSTSRSKVGLVLAGGGARGAAHVGVLRALRAGGVHVQADQVAGRPGIEERAEGNTRVVALDGCWDVARIRHVDVDLRRLAPVGSGPVRIDLAGITRMDTSGALVVERTRRQLEAAGRSVDYVNPSAEVGSLLDQARQADFEIPRPEGWVPGLVLEQSGRAVVSVTHEILGLLSFAGRTVLVLLKTLVNPRRLRFTSVVYHIEQTGFNAIPVAGLLCFLIGAVIAYMGITMLKLFGAGILTVELVGFVILRELGVLLVAILVAGRSGSAFTAEIGSMKSREELDALNTIGMDPIELLVVPRVLALLIALPALTFLGDVAGLIGGGMVCATELDLSDVAFLARLQEGVAGKHFFAGMVKAPVFAILIATIGCYQGFMVEGTAESVGARTTRSVVHGIFAVILADAFFAIYFMQIKW